MTNPCNRLARRAGFKGLWAIGFVLLLAPLYWPPGPRRRRWSSALPRAQSSPDQD